MVSHSQLTAQSRKQQLADLLDEHAQLVSQVSVMEVDRQSVGQQNGPQSDKENSH